MIKYQILIISSLVILYGCSITPQRSDCSDFPQTAKIRIYRAAFFTSGDEIQINIDGKGFRYNKQFFLDDRANEPQLLTEYCSENNTMELYFRYNEQDTLVYINIWEHEMVRVGVDQHSRIFIKYGPWPKG